MNLSEQSCDFFKNYLRLFRKNIKQYNLTESQALCLVSVPFDGISQTRLSHNLSLNLSTVSRNLSHLIKLDLIIKKKSNQDIRSYNIILSDKGKKIYTKINKSIDNHFYNICTKLDSNEKDLLIDLLNKINWQFELQNNE
tara:strand:- start:29907 stop:30326 length:420 start_codon:yes stop_codon:yes gene_type:complete